MTILSEYLKPIGRGVAFAVAIPFWLSYRLASMVRQADDILLGYSQLLSLLPGRFGSYVRVAFYRLTLEACDATAHIEFGVLFSKTGARIGKRVYIGPYSQIGLVTIEDDVLIASAVQIPSGGRIHGFDRVDIPIREQTGEIQRLTIARDCWIGAGSIVLADVAEQSVVGAGSVVTHSFPLRSVIVGNPARILSTRGDRNEDR